MSILEYILEKIDAEKDSHREEQPMDNDKPDMGDDELDMGDDEGGSLDMGDDEEELDMGDDESLDDGDDSGSGDDIKDMVDTIIKAAPGKSNAIKNMLKYAANTNPDDDIFDDALDYFESIEKDIEVPDETEPTDDIDMSDDMGDDEEELDMGDDKQDDVAVSDVPKGTSLSDMG